MNLEKERRYLVELPLTSEAELQLKLADSVEIIQTYLTNEKNLIERVRKTSLLLFQQTINHFFHTIKKPVSFGIAEEYEEEISEKQYLTFLKEKLNPNHFQIEKTRHFIYLNDFKFELDMFKGKLESISILEIEMDNLDLPIFLPPFLKIIKEITGDSSYSNFTLSKVNNGY